MEWCLTLGDIEKACKGELLNADCDDIVKNVVTDSRKITEGCIFVALKGENFDGHRFVRQSVDSGAVCCVVDSDDDFGSLPIIRVQNTYTALKDIAKRYRAEFDIPFVAVTGSVGKTSTKEMIYSVLSQEYTALKTNGNFNNEIGVPLTLFRLSSDDEIAVLEMGMSGFGEISELSKMVLPETAVITNIGLSHIEHLGSQENILKAKLEILDGLSSDGSLILNGDDEFLYSVSDDIPYDTIYYGMKNHRCDLFATNVKQYSDSSTFDVKIDAETYNFEIKVAGEHHIYNALAAIITGIQYNISIDKIIDGIREFMPVGMRQNIMDLERYILIKDCYNASPASMKSGLEVLMREYDGKHDRKRRKAAILADMLELGDYSVQSHIDVGKLAVKYGVDCLITVGKMAENIAFSAISEGFDKNNVFVFYDNDSLKERLFDIIREGDIILIKGSRGMKLEEIADFIEENCK